MKKITHLLPKWKGRNFIKEIREEQRKKLSGPVKKLIVKHLK